MEGSGTQGFLGCPGSASRPGALSPGLVPTPQVTALKCAALAAPAETGKIWCLPPLPVVRVLLLPPPRPPFPSWAWAWELPVVNTRAGRARPTYNRKEISGRLKDLPEATCFTIMKTEAQSS